MTTVRRALALAFLERYLTVALALGSNMLLARLLTPHEIGVYAVSLAVIGVAQVLREFGIGNYLIQEKELGDEHLRTAFGLSLLLGGALFVVVFAAAPLAAGFYGEPAMTQTLRIAALNFLVLPFCTVRLALLRRDMAFKALLVVTVAATVLSQVATVAMAWSGLGPNSMAIGSVLLNVAMSVGGFMAHHDKRILAPSLRLWRPLLRFGGQSALTNVITSVSIDVNDLVVAKVLGFGPVAMLSRAQGLMNLFHRDVMGAVRNVAFPAFAKANRDGQAMTEPLAKAAALVTALAWPFYILVSVYSLEALRLLFGSQWDAAARLVPFFCAAGVLSAMTTLSSTAVMAVGRIDLVTRAELIIQPAKLALIVTAVVVHARVEAAAVAYATAALMATPMLLWISNRALPGSAIAILRASRTSLPIAAAVALPALGVAGAYGFDRHEPIPLVVLAAAVVASLALGVACAEVLGHPASREPAYMRMKQRMRRLSQVAG